ncbi:MAG: efflux RND transporter permease subunit, partial [Candidatus Eremiobacteraeota bacterium]|nr:efflux RND transporter permease subunit [Candidatus Eremiobacteraeota bacterium]
MFAALVLTILGVYAYTVVPASIFPNMTFARIDVVANVGDLPPDQVRIAVAVPLQRAFQGLPRVLRIRTTSTQGSAEFVVECDPKSDVQVDLQHVNEAIAQTRAVLPPQTNIVANVINPNSEPVVSYALTSSSLSQTLLHELAEQTIVPQFYGISGLSRMLVVGGPQREYHVSLTPSSLAVHGLSVADVSKAIADANTVSSIGLSERYYQRNVLFLDANIRSVETLRRVTVANSQKNAVALGSLGTVGLGVGPQTDQVSFGARHSVIINAYGLPGADAVKVARAIKARFARIQNALPRGILLSNYWDQTDLVVESQRSLRDAILLGALLAVLVIYAFLRNLRMTLIAAIVIPIAMAVAIFVLQRTGETLNLMSVGGLAVAVGLIIDDAIVVIENIARNFRETPQAPKRDIIRLAMSQLGAPMIASTLTTVVVFLPLTMLSGVSGFFFRALALTLASALIVSLALALFVAPILADFLIRRATDAREKVGFITHVLDRYEPLLRWALSHRGTVYFTSAGVLLVTVALLITLPNDFLPKLDEGQFEIGYRMPVGTTLSASDAAATSIERIVLNDPAVAAEGRLTGIDSNGFSPMPASRGLIRVKLKSRSQREGYDVVTGRLREQIAAAVPAAQLDFHQILEDMINDLSGTPAPVEVLVRGPEQATLIRLADLVAQHVRAVAGVADTSSGVVYDDPTIRITPNMRQLSALGMTSSDFGAAVTAAAQGSVATSLASTVNLIPVRVALAGVASALSQSAVVTASGSVALANVARLTPGHLSTDINEENGQRIIRVTANISGANLSSVVSGIRSALREVALPPGYGVSIGGQYGA